MKEKHSPHILFFSLNSANLQFSSVRNDIAAAHRQAIARKFEEQKTKRERERDMNESQEVAKARSLIEQIIKNG